MFCVKVGEEGAVVLFGTLLCSYRRENAEVRELNDD